MRYFCIENKGLVFGLAAYNSYNALSRIVYFIENFVPFLLNTLMILCEFFNLCELSYKYMSFYNFHFFLGTFHIEHFCVASFV